MSWHDNPIYIVGNFLFDSPFRTLWPLVAAPAMAALFSDRAARLLPQQGAAWPAAAALAAAPGLLGAAVICQAMNLDHVITWRGVFYLRIAPFVAALLAAYAIGRALRRQAEINRLFAAAAPAGPRLAEAARRLGLRVRELPTREKDCFVAGLVRPTVFVSRGALDRLGDAELEAALCHERAHVEGGDTLFLMALSLLRDLAPWGRGAALEAFVAAREARADRLASAAAGPLNLAGALVALARPGPASAVAALPMARRDTLRWRMQALLQTEVDAPAGARGLVVAAAVAANLALVAWPAAQAQLFMMFCEGR